MTSSATGSPGGEGARTYIQVLANSVIASILVILHIRNLEDAGNTSKELCAKIAHVECGFAAYANPLIAGIIA